jgi:hypothetical protein
VTTIVGQCRSTHKYADRQRPHFGRSGRWGGLSGSCVVVVLVLAGTDRVRLRLVRGGYGAARWRGSAEVPGRRIAGRQQVHELAAAPERLSKPGVGESCPVVLAGSFPVRGTRRRRCSCLRFRGAGRGCTHLYAGSAARVARRTYIWWTASSQRASPDGVYAGHRPGGGGGRSGL